MNQAGSKNEDNNQSKNNKQPDMPENQTAWNSDNQGVKETFTQMGRKARWTAEWVERIQGKVVGREGEAGLAEWETKDSKPQTAKSCGD